MSTRMTSSQSFWVMIAAYLGLMFAASAPSPLYVEYAEKWHFTAITLTSIFGVYALALLVTLLTVGGLSDFIGRKPVLLGSFTLLAASMLVFAKADGVAWLYAARVLQGLAAGSAIGALSAGIIDFAGPSRARFAGLVNSLAPALGLALGALGAGALVQYGPAPTTLVYLLLAGFFVLIFAAIAAGPESEARRPGALRSLTPRMRVPKRIRSRFLRMVPGMLAPWAQFGLTLSLTTSVAATKFGVTDTFLQALVVSVVFGAAFVANIVIRDAPTRLSTLAGCTALIVGSALTMISLAGPWTILFYAGSMLSGAGAGTTVGAAMRTLSVMPDHAERGEFFASVYVVGYLAFSIPAIIAGYCVVHAGLVPTMIGYGIGIIVLALIAGANALPTPQETTTELEINLPEMESARP